MAKHYRYVGPEAIRRKVAGAPAGVRADSIRDLEEWLRRTDQRPNPEGLFAVTFVVAEDGWPAASGSGSSRSSCRPSARTESR
jgi:hypothetical protein